MLLGCCSGFSRLSDWTSRVRARGLQMLDGFLVRPVRRSLESVGREL